MKPSKAHQPVQRPVSVLPPPIPLVDFLGCTWLPQSPGGAFPTALRRSSISCSQRKAEHCKHRPWQGNEREQTKKKSDTAFVCNSLISPAACSPDKLELGFAGNYLKRRRGGRTFTLPLIPELEYGWSCCLRVPPKHPTQGRKKSGRERAVLPHHSQGLLWHVLVNTSVLVAPAREK